MSPRRIFAALAVLALAVLTATAGAAFASDFRGVADGHDNGWHGKDHDPGASGGDGAGANGGGGTANGGDPNGGSGEDPNGGSGEDPNGGSGEVDGAGAGSGSSSGSGSGAGSNDGVVTGSGAGTPSVPVEAPAVAASGPAPDAATAAPASVPPPSGVTADAFVAAVDTTDAPGDVVPAADAASVATPALPTSDLAGLDALPTLGSIGDVADQVTDGPSAARALLSTGTGQSLAVILSLLVAISVFLAVHRRTDRGDRKLAAARTGPEVARFR